MAKSNGKTWKKVLKYSIITITTIVLLIGLLFLTVYLGAFGRLPDKKELASISTEEASLVFSTDNALIGKFFAQNRTIIKRKDIPDHLKNALIATEDKRFFTHKGYDLFSYFRVFFKSILLQDNAGGGGSTLTQQLVKNLYGRKNYSLLTVPVNKMKEIVIASRLEEIYNKDELLVLYLNSVPFGEDVYGVESAARRFFGKPASQLRVEESAVLIGMLKANTYYNPILNPESSMIRRNVVLSQMQKEKYLTAKEVERLKKIPLKLNYEKVALAPAAYFVQQVKKKTEELLDSIKDATGNAYDLEKDGLRIYTTLNMEVQEMAAKAVSSHMATMQKLLDKELENRKVKKLWLAKQKQLSDDYQKDAAKHNVRLFTWDGPETRSISKFDSLWYYYKMLHAAVLITNPRNGEVITWLGGNNFQTLPFDMILSHRQVASVFKPILYATALEKGIEPCTYLENSKTTYEGYENWEPENYNRESTSDSTVAMWYALTHSLNLPSIDLYFKVGKEDLSNTCQRLQFSHAINDAPSVALGALDLSLYEVVKAYSSFANHGQMNNLVMIKKITDAKGHALYTSKHSEVTQVFDSKTTETITAILQQVVSQGTGASIRSRFGIRSNLAGKTGTAQHYSNAWFVAYTPNLVIGTWVGASTPDVHFNSGNGSGSALAMPVAGYILKNIENNVSLRNKYLTSFAMSDSVYAFLQCDPYHEIGAKGFFSRLFGRKAKTNDNDTTGQAKEKEKGIRAFFKKLFGRKSD